ncbi:MAG TPA: protein kinase [Bryobacteraceae bacterium]|nr:protein kinase [Bryobacteraceae bacterium]
MPLTPGTRLGPFEILAPLGAGGMGEVYKARDTRLDRIVAVKVASQQFSERFEREARAVAALNHSNICTLYDVGPNYLVMEYIEGTPLQGPLPLDLALNYGSQICDALDAAHRKGITHRDLKPGNILVTKQGIKLLDFGLAKQAGVGINQTDTTLTEALTSQGQIVGTLQYMSPEQLQAQAVDSRSDIFSFGLVLYEMLAGKRAFESTSGATLIAAILKDQPQPLSAVQPKAPASLQRILDRCLEKDPERRWQNARDLGRELQDLRDPHLVAPATRRPAPSRVSRWWLALIPVALVAGFGIARWTAVEHSESLDAVPLTTLAGIEQSPALSPDGKLVAFTWTGPDYGSPKLSVKQLDASEPLVLSQGPDGSPAWSPDGHRIAFLRRGDDGTRVMIVPALGGPERQVGPPLGASFEGGLCWLPIANRLVFGAGGLGAVSVDNGQLQHLTEAESGKSDLYPALSPDGGYLAFVRTISPIAEAPSRIFYLRLDGKQQPEPGLKLLTAVLQGVGGLAWAPDGRSLIVSALRRGTVHLFRVRFPGGQSEQMMGVSASGDFGGSLSISPAARNMALAIAENDTDIWRVAGPAWPESKPRPEPARFLASTRDDVTPDYSADGKKIAFESRRTGSQEIWSVDSAGQNAVQVTNFGGPAVGSPRWSPDGTRIAFDSRKFGKADIFVVSGNGGTATRLTPDDANYALPAWSSDGRWIFCRSDRSGRSEIWKIPADGGTPLPISNNGGADPQHLAGEPWLYYRDQTGIVRTLESGGGTVERMIPQFDAFWGPWREGIVTVDGLDIRYFRFRDRKSTLLQRLAPLESERSLRRPALAVSPDGQWVLLRRTALDRGDLILVENIQ